MANATLDPRIDEVRKKYGLSNSDFWELPQKKGTWVAKHAALEGAAAKAGIVFDPPLPLEANGIDKCVALCVTGHLKDRSEWSIGEASPANNRNAYVYAMAEKRGKDRVILKLIGLHGLAYSEEEADDFKAKPANGRKSSAQAKRDGDWEMFLQELDECKTVVALDMLRKAYESEVYPKASKAYQQQYEEKFEERQAELTADDLKGTLEDSVSSSLPYQTKADYVVWLHDRIDTADNPDALRQFWKDQRDERTRFRFTQKEVDGLKERVTAKLSELSVELMGAG